MPKLSPRSEIVQDKMYQDKKYVPQIMVTEVFKTKGICKNLLFQIMVQNWKELLAFSSD